MSKLKGRRETGPLDILRPVGEKAYPTIARKTPRKKRIEVHTPSIHMECKRCGKEGLLSSAQIHNWCREGWTCSACRSKGKDEVRDAMLAIALKKQKLKKR